MSNSIPTWSMSSETKIHPYVGRESNSIVTRSNSLEMSKHPQVGGDRNSITNNQANVIEMTGKSRRHSTTSWAKIQ